MARKKLHREPVLKDWAEVNDALRSIHEYEHALTEMGVDMSRRIDAVKAEYTKSAEPLQKRVKQLETDVQEYVEAHREDMAGKSRQLTFGRVGFRQSTRLILANAKVPQAIATLLAMGRRELVKTEQKLDKEALKQQPEEVLEAVGAYLKTTDEFFYDTGVPFPVSWTVKMKKKQKETQDILSYHTQAAGCSDKARAKASGGRQPIEECGRTGL